MPVSEDRQAELARRLLAGALGQEDERPMRLTMRAHAAHVGRRGTRAVSGPPGADRKRAGRGPVAASSDAYSLAQVSHRVTSAGAAHRARRAPGILPERRSGGVQLSTAWEASGGPDGTSRRMRDRDRSVPNAETILSAWAITNRGTAFARGSARPTTRSEAV